MGNLRQSKFKSVFLQNLEAKRLGVTEEPEAKKTIKKTAKRRLRNEYIWGIRERAYLCANKYRT